MIATDVVSRIALRLADDELILGHRHSEWTGYAPHIEEDVAFSSIAQDEIGHAAAYYALAAQGSERTADELAFGREPDEYRNALLCERPNGDWAYTLARHWLYDTADEIRLTSLEQSTHSGLAQLTAKIRREERYHLLHADMWLRRVAHGPLEGRTKLVHSLSEAFPDALGLFEPFPDEEAALAEGVLTEPSSALLSTFMDRSTETLDRLGLPSGISSVSEQNTEFVASSSGDLLASDPSEAASPVHPATARGQHSELFQELWDVMTRTFRENPGARW